MFLCTCRIQKFLLQPREHIQMGGKPVDNSESNAVKGKKVISQIVVEGEMLKDLSLLDILFFCMKILEEDHVLVLRRI